MHEEQSGSQVWPQLSEWRAGGCVRQGLVRPCVHAKSFWSCSTLCDLMDCSLPGSSQARILAWVIMPSSRGSSQPRDRTCVSSVSCIGRRILYHCVTGEATKLTYNVLLVSGIQHNDLVFVYTKKSSQSSSFEKIVSW